MPNENNLLPEHAQLAAVLDNPEAIKSIKEPTEKCRLPPYRKSRNLSGYSPTLRKSTAFRLIASPESVLLMQAPSPLACFTAVEGCSRRTCRPQPVFWLQPGGWYSG